MRVESPDHKKDLRQNNSVVLHASAYQMKQWIDQAADLVTDVPDDEKMRFNDYHIFSTVRNPYRKLVSFYFFAKPDANFILQNQEGYNESTAFHHHFNDFISHMADNESYFSLPNYEQFFTNWSTGESLVDDKDIFKVEELSESFIPRFEEVTNINLGITELPKILPIEYDEKPDVTEYKWRGDVRDLYNESSKQYVEEKYATDLLKFNYGFD